MKNKKEVKETKVAKDTKLVNLRALLILIVVLGHSIIIYSSSWNQFTTINQVHFLDVLKNSVINSYQMQLFFSLSGYLFYYTVQKNKKYLEFTIDKIKRLIIPFLGVGILFLVPIKMILNVPGFTKGSYIYNCFNAIIKMKHTGHLWFLVTLFIIFVLFFTLSKIVKIDKKDTKYILLDVVILLITLFSTTKIAFFKNIIPQTTIYRVFSYAFWFYLGFCINKYFALGREDEAYKRWFVPFLFLLTGALVILRISHASPIIKLASAICVIITAYLIIPSKTNKVTEYLDRNSMGMFLFHSPLIYISYKFYPNIHPALMVFINFVCFGFLASLLTELIRKTPVKILIGEYNKNKK